MLRLFIALPLEQSGEQELGRIIDGLRTTLRADHAERDVKWINPRNIHVTLKFLGDTAEKEVPALCEAIEGALKLDGTPLAGMEFVANRVGAFPSMGKPSVLWVGLDGSRMDRLATLASRVDTALSALGREPERRPFKPHLTIGRVREGAETHAISRALTEAVAPRFEVTFKSLVLFKSDLKPTGPVYTRLREWQF